MRFFIGSAVFVGFLLILFFGGMLSNQTGLLMVSSMGFCLLGNPLVWVATYRLFTGAAGGRIAWVPADQQRNKVTHKTRSVGVGGDL